ncbi:hypothetical protein BGX27_006037 [Mortierella sp. AM989]|nr:hypothetical protein BGX27_006037 [Mortierella sp. AM989]
MGMARKIAGVTKSDEIYGTLESRFGMFLNSNTQGAEFAVQCVGFASTTHMELAGDAEIDDPIDNVLMGELDPSTRDLDEAEIAQDKRHLRESIEQDRGELSKALASGPGTATSRLQRTVAAVIKTMPAGHASGAAEEHSEEQMRHQGNVDQIAQPHSHLTSGNEGYGEHDDNSSSYNNIDYNEGAVNHGLTESTESADDERKYSSDCEIPLTKLTTSESDSSWRFSKSASLLKGAFRRVKPSIMSSSNGSMDSLGHTPSQSQNFAGSAANLSITNIHLDGSAKPPVELIRADSSASVLTQMTTQYENLGEGRLPTIHTSSIPGGHFYGTLRMSNSEIEEFKKHAGNDVGGVIGGHPKSLKLHAHHDDMASPATGVVNLIDPEGVSIISDIDDTIKYTNVTSGTRVILRNTFLKSMKEVEGMANAYKKWWIQGAAFHYVSNSPWQLIPTLLDFFHTHMFPPGSAHLKVHDNNILKTYFMTPGENKRRSIREILNDFPDRKFILVGDSGEIDLEIYTEIAMEFPKQIFRIFIRDITTARLKEMASKAPPLREGSFSSLKAPISAVTTGFGLFGRQGSSGTISLKENASTPNKGTETDIDVPVASSPGEMSEEELTAKTKKESSSLFGKIKAFSPKLEPSSPSSLSVPKAGSASSSPASSPHLQPNRSLLSLALRNLSTTSLKRNARSPGVSPLALEITSVSNEYPFPTTESSISQQSGNTGTSSNISDGHKDSEDIPNGLYLNNNVSHLSLTEETQEQEVAQFKQKQIKQGRSRANTFSHSSSSNSSLISTPAGTPSGSIWNTPLQSPSASPRMSDRRNPGQTGHILTTTPSNPCPATPLGTPSSGTATLISNSPSISSSTSSKTPLEIWQDRVTQCKRKLPEGVLTLFESADVLEKCQIVKDMFAKFDSAGQDKKNASASNDAANDILDQVSASNSTTSVSTSESVSSEDLFSSVERIDHGNIDQLKDRNCRVSA